MNLIESKYAEIEHAEIARRYARLYRQNDRPRTKPGLACLRVTELDRFYRKKHGRFLPNNADGRSAVHFMAWHIAQYRGDPLKNVIGWVRANAPWMSSDESEALAFEFIDRPPLPSADVLGRLIGLTDELRTYLKIRTIGAVGIPKDERARLRKQADRDYQASRRRAAGAKPRSGSYSRTEPWKHYGITRRTWEKRGKPMPDANSSAVEIGKTLSVDEIAQRPSKAAARKGARKALASLGRGTDRSVIRESDEW